jgi:hypothetical protein
MSTILCILSFFFFFAMIRKLVSLVYNAQRQHFCAKIIGRSVVGGPMQQWYRAISTLTTSNATMILSSTWSGIFTN